jgi:uncharacterized membrane protein
VPAQASTFVAVVLEHDHSPDEALATVRALRAHKDVSVRDAAVVIRTAIGRIELQQTKQIAPGESIVGGGTAGLVAGLLLGLPIGGALVGLAGGALLGLRDTGIPNKRMRQLGEDLQPGQSLLCVLVNADTDAVARTREALERYGTAFEVELSSGTGP